jgi:hypothetical protein
MLGASWHAERNAILPISILEVRDLLIGPIMSTIHTAIRAAVRHAVSPFYKYQVGVYCCAAPTNGDRNMRLGVVGLFTRSYPWSPNRRALAATRVACAWTPAEYESAHD